MKVSAYLYVKRCKEAFIPLAVSEKEILQEMTDPKGEFDREEYLAAVNRGSPVFVADNQKTILKWLPTSEDDPFIASEKNKHCKLLVKKMRRANR